jgi:Clp amino terminal domain, pathogenicity island component
MTPKATTGLILGGAVALAVGAYGVGSQANGGSAAAKGAATAYGQGYGPGPGGGFGGRGRFLDDAASQLGVTPAALRSALESLRGERRDDRQGKRDELASSLAASLGVPVAKVQAALDKLAPKGKRGRWRGDRGGPPPGGAPPPLRGRRGPGGPGRGLLRADRLVSALATELGVPKADVQKAIETFRTKEESEHAAQRDAFAQKLADKLGISVDKVKSVLERGPGGGP